ncbi:exsB protein [Desulfurobacterium thermolithotrophum DSM 11699]|uniref:7-cyano-7-deazaguanine synthase n=1 Tax=Desulfurobacterium thermolithotrophum (strain DSM 11699 / BSA) TaxID=868864 RepID=F0S1L5_DESTD|nr:7-cyano-7-deazaguanine synthase QueC [Desulfurobacterium thermolithotrophum]ADY74018.1 exsB protein [Desulfurobacterium thermolithotrophum DSM 11699]
MSSAIVILSGGLDSTTALYWAKKNFNKVFAITFYYGQRHSLEVEMARIIAKKAKVEEHILFEVDISKFGGSALTDKNLEVPETQSIEEIKERGIPITYVPFRNGIFLSIAAAYAETKNTTNLVGGWNAVDYSGYPDCRPEFLAAMEEALNKGTKLGSEGKSWKIHAPLINLTKGEIIKLGLSLGADYSYSISCYRGTEVPCGKCDSCVLRAKGWMEVGKEDHLIERLKREGKV